jgi:hypothetical protein
MRWKGARAPLDGPPDGWRDEAGEHKEEHESDAHGDDDGLFAHPMNIDLDRVRTRRTMFGLERAL